MTEHIETSPSPLTRLPTGISGLDTILGGGLFKGGIYVVAGSPGAGKTILANQLCAHHVRSGGRALYVTLLAETHGRMLAHLSSLTFFEPAAVGSRLKYVSAFSAVEQEGLAGLLKVLREAVREHKAGVLVLDGMVTATTIARSGVDYKKFIHELQTWVAVHGCTVLFLTSGGEDGTLTPEHTMVDGIFELGSVVSRLRSLRQLRVTKFRGSGYLEGLHPYAITSAGVVVHPRVEVAFPPRAPQRASATRVSLGSQRLDQLLGGGLRCGSTTLVVGSSGAGKTVLGMQFLAAGLEANEPVLHFGFYEDPAELVAKASRFGWSFERGRADGTLSVVWQPATEHTLDELAYRLLDAARKSGAKRLFIDGLVGFKEAVHQERLSAIFSLISDELGALGVTTLITEETRELFVRRIEIPTIGVSAVFHNIIFLRQVERGSELLRLLTVMKTRDSAHDRGLYQIDITDRGLDIGERFKTTESILTGVSSERRWREENGPGVGDAEL